ncbi:MAG: molybdenum cofactor biosynthesis protein MoaE [Planctomycetota bacterium]|nr:molybdenum cofactor biosynthesis protein MoaE [Planctomycetota bacterium]
MSLTENAIDTEAILASVASPRAGAVLLFVGTTREVTGDRVTESLDYSGYREMALEEMQRLADRAAARWPLSRVAMEHRLGHVAIGEASVAIALSAPHRKEAFEAGEWLIDQLKESVPIWKRENWADGTCEWVHPGLSSSTETSH